MKKVTFLLILIAGLTLAVNAQTNQTDKKSSTTGMEQMQLKDHVCSTACKDGKHLYAHGEKGHVCTAECKKMESGTDKMTLKDHVCTSACKDGKHVYAHGEKGHVCTADCKKM